jgi:hypothetical protein
MIYKDEKIERHFHLNQRPYQLKYVYIGESSYPVIGINLNNKFCIYDERVSEKNGKVVQVQTSGSLYSISQYSSNIIAVGGKQKFNKKERRELFFFMI